MWSTGRVTGWPRRTLLGGLAATAAWPAARARARQAPLAGQIELKGPRLRTPVTIGGQGPFDFIIDTGAFASGVDPRLAQRLGLPGVASQGIEGIGGYGVATAGVYRARDVVMGGVFRQPEVIFLGLPGFDGEGEGLLAAGVFTSFDTDLDLDAGVWRVWRDGRPDHDGYERLDCQITGGERGSSTRVVVHARLDGWAGRFLLDTGAPSIVNLAPWTARARGYWRDDQPFAAVAEGGVIGRDLHPGRIVRAGRLELGGFSVDRPLVTVRDPRSFAAPGDERLDGLIGLGMIRRLNLSFDARRSALWARRNALPPPAEARYRLSGLWLDRIDDQRASVAEVSPASAAAEAGLKPGDVLRTGGLSAFLRRSVGPAGRVVEVGVERGAGVETVRMTLRPYL